MEIKETCSPYLSLKSNAVLLSLYTRNANKLGVNFDPTVPRIGGSTDAGNVSQVRPTIQPKMAITADGNPHTEAFATASCQPENQGPTIVAGKTLGFCGIDILYDPTLSKNALNDFMNS